MQTNFVVATEADLAAVISAIDVGGFLSAASTTYTISFATPTLTLSADLPAINLATYSTLEIDGLGGTLDGGGIARGLYVYSGNVLVRNLTIADAVAQGGAGMSGLGGGGGGAGLGGGLFIAQSGTVTLDGVDFVRDSAIGGAGGALVNPNSVSLGNLTGVSGGFGNGGAGGGSGGSGGFGGGGGGGYGDGGSTFGGGYGGFFNGVTGGGGGGGLGAGADIFVHAGGLLTITAGTLQAGVVAGGQGGSGGGNGYALGSAIVLSGTQPFSLKPAAGQTVRIDGVIADVSIAGEPATTATRSLGGNAGTGVTINLGQIGGGTGSTTSFISVDFRQISAGFIDPYIAPPPVLPGSGGTVLLTGVNTYYSGTSVFGTLELGNAQAAGYGTITLAAADAVLRIDGAAIPTNRIAGLVSGDTIDLTGHVAAARYATVGWGADFTAALLVPTETGQVALRLAGQLSGYDGLVFTLGPDGAGGAAVTAIAGATVASASGGSFVVPIDNRGYAGAAQTRLAAANAAVTAGTLVPQIILPGAGIPTLPAASGGELVLHQAGAVTVPTGYATFVTDAASRVSITGGTDPGQLIVAGTSGLDFTAGAGAGTVIAGGGVNHLTIGQGGGNQVLLLGDGQDTVLAMAGDDTIDGNIGGKQILLGDGANLVISHAADSGSGDVILGGSAATTIVSNGNALAAGLSGRFDAMAGHSIVYGGAGTVTVNASGGSVMALTGAAMQFTASIGGNLLIGNGSDARLQFTRTTGDARGTDVVMGEKGSVTVTTAFGGTYLGGAAGNNRIDVQGGVASITGGGAGDLLRLSAGASGTITGGSGAETLTAGTGQALLVAGDGPDLLAAGSGNTTLVAGPGADTLQGGPGADLFTFQAWRGGGSATVAGWNPAQDHLSFQGYAPELVLTHAVAAQPIGNDLLFSLSDGTRITFLNTASLDPSRLI